MPKHHPLVSVRNLTKVYGDGRVKTLALRNVSFDIYRGEFAALTGPSGSGKSTAFHQIALLDTSTSGTILFAGRPVSDFTSRERSRFRLRKIGYVFQHYELLPELTALENVYLPLLVEGHAISHCVSKACAVLADVGLEQRKNHYPGELSGGEKQRVAIARALVNEPLLILADEPTANLDSTASHEILSLLKRLNRTKKITVCVITHERELLSHFNRIIHLKDGKVIKIQRRKVPSKTH